MDKGDDKAFLEEKKVGKERKLEENENQNFGKFNQIEFMENERKSYRSI